MIPTFFRSFFKLIYANKSIQKITSVIARLIARRMPGDRAIQSQLYYFLTTPNILYIKEYTVRRKMRSIKIG